MTSHYNEVPLTPEERALYASAERESPIDSREEERAVAALRVRGLLLQPGRSYTRRYPVAVIGAAAAIIVVCAGVAGLVLQPRSVARLQRTDSVSHPPAVGAGRAESAHSTSPSFLAWY